MTDAKSKVLTPEQVAMEQKQLATWLVNKHDLVTRESLVIALAAALQSHEALRAERDATLEREHNLRRALAASKDLITALAAQVTETIVIKAEYAYGEHRFGAPEP